VTGQEHRQHLPAGRRVDRERIIRTLTFWLRPDFILRALNRFNKLAGFDRAIGLSASALTALIPLLIVLSSVSSALGGSDSAERIINRYDLTGGGAQAVRDVFSPPEGASTAVSVAGILFVLLAVLSFTRAMQRLFEQTWELKPLSVRNTFNGLLWIGGLTLYLGASGWLHANLELSDLELGAALLSLPLSAVFLTWSGWVLMAKRVPWRELIPFAAVGAVVLALCQVAARVYVPHLFSSYSSRYGVIGSVFAMISTLFITMTAVVGSAAVGREVQDELGRIRRGERPAEHEVKRQWDELRAELGSRWQTLHEEVARRRARRHASQ
jgi:uncharacterized BrkB/YihY/UPF0761 family membrane protein